MKVGTILPPNCAATQGGCGASTGAPANGTYPFVFNNDLYDGSFGITSRIFLDQLTPNGWLIDSLEVPNSLDRGIKSSSDQLVTSFSSKSEIALHLSTDHRSLTFMGYVAPVNTLDVSNSNTPLAIDPTNPVGRNSFAPSRGGPRRAIPFHRDQRLQRQQRPLRDPEQLGRRTASSTPRAMPATAPTRSPMASCSARARSSST